VGFNPDLTARDNVLINAVMLGVSPAQARERYDAIIAFAELEDFQDLKLKNYSSGMQVRLAFSVMVHVDADLLLIDEVLAVGDAAFQQKCHDVLNRARDEGKTILLVTHDMGQVQRFCDRALLLERGEVVALDNARTVARRYTQLNFATRDDAHAVRSLSAGMEGDGSAEIVDAWVQTAGGRRTDTLEHGGSCALVMRLRVLEPADEPIFGFVLSDEQHRRVLVVTSEADDRPTGRFEAGDVVDVAVSFDNWFAPGRYFLSPQVGYPGTTGRLKTMFEDFTTFIITGTQTGGGIVDIPHQFDWSARDPDVAKT
jgi:energy-coupling factor transporter ATP-binding protein EcfA2